MEQTMEQDCHHHPASPRVEGSGVKLSEAMTTYRHAPFQPHRRQTGARLLESAVDALRLSHSMLVKASVLFDKADSAIDHMQQCKESHFTTAYSVISKLCHAAITAANAYEATIIDHQRNSLQPLEDKPDLALFIVNLAHYHIYTAIDLLLRAGHQVDRYIQAKSPLVRRLIRWIQCEYFSVAIPLESIMWDNHAISNELQAISATIQHRQLSFPDSSLLHTPAKKCKWSTPGWSDSPTAMVDPHVLHRILYALLQLKVRSYQGNMVALAFPPRPDLEAIALSLLRDLAGVSTAASEHQKLAYRPMPAIEPTVFICSHPC